MRTKFLATAALVSLACLSASTANAQAVPVAFRLFHFGRSVALAESRFALSMSRHAKALALESDDAVSAITKLPDITKSAARLKFNVLDGKLKIGSLKKFPGIEIEGGEINLYKIGSAGVGAAYCGTAECLKTAGRWFVNEVVKTKELAEGIQKVTEPATRSTLDE